jgi:1,4-dihydroxy-2-naphthoate polyprenyltransferase
MAGVKSRSRTSAWVYALRTTNPPPHGPVDAVTGWIVVTRATVLSMTLFGGLVAALLSVGEPGLDWRRSTNERFIGARAMGSRP